MPGRTAVAWGLATLLLALAPAVARAEDNCRSLVGGTWSGVPPFDGTVVWSCTGGDGVPGADDAYAIEHPVTIEGALFSAEAPLVGRLTVRDRLDLSDTAPVVLHLAGPVAFEDGSDGRWQGFELAAAAVPSGVSFPTPTTIRLDFGDPAPWPLCDPSGPGATCPASTVHPADPDPGEPSPATQLWFDFEKLPALEPPAVDAAAAITDWLVDAPGSYLAVAGVADGDGDGELDALVLSLPDSGADHGWRSMGSDGEGALDPQATEGRCEECFEQGVPAPTCGGVPGAGRFTSGDTSGCRLRNAVGEGAWTVSPTTPWRLAYSATRQPRFEVLVTAGAFDDDGEFEGQLFCVPGAAGDWCARIAASQDGAGPLGEDVLVVLRDPASAVAPGAAGAVYYARPFPGDRIVPANMHYVNGSGMARLSIVEGSEFGIGYPLHALHFDELTDAFGLRVENLFDWSLDLVLMEHFGSDVPGSSSFLVLTTESNQEPEADGVEIRRLTCRFPDQHVEIANLGGTVGGGAQCVKTKTPNAALSGPPDVWRGVTFRKVRGVGLLETLNLNEPAFSDCPDDLLVQDLIVLHKLMPHRASPNWNNESLELRGGHRRCDVDRVLFAGTASGSDIIMRCESCEEGFGVTLSSVVCLGSSAGTGAGTCTGSNASAAGRSTVTNWLTNRAVEVYGSHRLGSLVGHFPSGALNGLVSGCQDTIGTHAVGGAAPGGWASTCDGTSSQAWLDDAWLFQNAAVSQWIGTQDFAPAELSVERTIFHTAEEANNRTLLRIDATDSPLTVRLRSGLIGSEGAGAGAALRLRQAAGVGLEIGPRLFASGPVRCREVGGTAVIFQDGELSETCQPADAHAADGDGSDEGWNRSAGEILAAGGLGFVDSPLSFSFEAISEAAPGCDEESCPLAESLPRWAGPVAYDWPFVWATAQPLPGFRRAAPAEGVIPERLEDRLVPACDNGLDDDGDGRIDAADVGCAGADDLSERSAVWPCDDGLDNDGDGLADDADPGCGEPNLWPEDPVCDDGLDNDGDGRVDFADAQCNPAWPYSEGRRAGSSCGLGPDLVLLVPWLRARRGRRRRRSGARVSSASPSAAARAGSGTATQE